MASALLIAPVGQSRSSRSSVSAGATHRGRPAHGGRVAVGPGRPAGGDHAVAKTAQYPHLARHPRHGQPELASMNGKSVRMSPANTLVHQHQVVERRRPRTAPGDQAVFQPHVIQHLALRSLGPAGCAAVGRVALGPQRPVRRLGRVRRRPGGAGGRSGRPRPSAPAAGQRIARRPRRRRAQPERRVGVVGRASRASSEYPDALPTGPSAPCSRARRGLQRAGAAQPVQERCRPHQRVRVRGDRLVQPADLGQQLGRARSAAGRLTPPGTTTPRPNRLPHSPPTSRSTLSLCQPNRAVATARPAASASRTATSRWLASRSSSACSTRTSAAVRRHLAARDPLDGVAVGQRVRDRRDAFGPLGQQHALGRGHALEPLARSPGACRTPACSGAGCPRPGSRPGTRWTR